MPTVFDASKSEEENYKITISCPGHGIDIICDMPEQITMATQSDWESLMNYSLAGALDAAIGGSGKLIAGLASAGSKAFNAQLQALSFQVWMGTSPIEFPLQIQFNAKKSALNDVYKPMGMLGAMVLPINKGGGVLFPPGPSIGGVAGGYGVHIRLGRLILFKECIITSSQATYDTRLDKDGVPISGEMEITFRTSTVYGHKDFLNALSLEVS